MSQLEASHQGTPKRLTRHGFAVVLLVGTLHASGLAHAQEVTTEDRSEAGNSEVRTRCAAALAALRSAPSPYEAPVLAREQLRRCEQSGPEMIAHLWAVAPDVRAELLELRRASRTIPDARILDAVLGTIASTDRPTSVRIAALDVLVGYAIPGAGLYPVQTHNGQSGIGISPHSYTHPGPRPLPTDVLQRLHTVLDQLVTDESDGEVRAYARQLRTALPDYGNAAPMGRIDPAKISLSYVCGNRFRVRNANVNSGSAILDYDLEGVTTPRIELRVRPRSESEPYAEYVFTVPVQGTIRLFHRGALIQTVANEGTACPRG